MTLMQLRLRTKDQTQPHCFVSSRSRAFAISRFKGPRRGKENKVQLKFSRLRHRRGEDQAHVNSQDISRPIDIREVQHLAATTFFFTLPCARALCIKKIRTRTNFSMLWELFS
ncbi:hypothetical protein Mp_8g17340 [Marchantia polymorpha subsp. ruderalis]|uniref:Uncharacterized protein n=1 Tax=Marchantia polymorpha TaxID=3197 RepID=A0A2R6X897_MARPO|nr:hypothetical protein MARPO_0030s0068 [Marchantia polymorpha]BBN20208.1 hypothetical protein Mp_8g17340 [Marchantia polymorpha subsp. ruderalis]|eukprot:PTQ42326.1 hypothetical protein MARPO_0030s0068 [Marchantia polymorpha]